MGTLYIGVSSNLPGRLDQHRSPMNTGFTGRYRVHRLVYAEWHDDIRDALRREAQMKKWRRAWKIRLIEEFNPEWVDVLDAELMPPW
jgi:putative endonuclease